MSSCLRGHQNLQFAVDLHLAGEEVLGHEEVADLRHELDPSVLLPDLD
jgi:hypothetical protein